MALLDIEQLSVRFGGVKALHLVDLDVAAGQATGVIGPNGAGKTTLFNAVCGLQLVERGRVVLDGDDITKVKAHRRARMGVARTFQRLELFRGEGQRRARPCHRRSSPRPRRRGSG